MGSIKIQTNCNTNYSGTQEEHWSEFFVICLPGFCPDTLNINALLDVIPFYLSADGARLYFNH